MPIVVHRSKNALNAMITLCALIAVAEIMDLNTLDCRFFLAQEITRSRLFKRDWHLTGTILSDTFVIKSKQVFATLSDGAPDA